MSAMETETQDNWNDLPNPEQYCNQIYPGQHLCWIYETEEDHELVVLEYVKKGLMSNEKILYISRSVEQEQKVKARLANKGINIESLDQKGQLMFKLAREVYIKDGIFDPEHMIQTLKEEVAKALTEGYSGIRGTGEMNWALEAFQGTERVFEYEAMLNIFFQESPHFIGMCQYDMRSFSPEFLLKVLTTHPYAIKNKEVFNNFYYIPPEQFLGNNLPKATLDNWVKNLKQRKQDELKIYQHTAELRKASAALTREALEKQRIQHAKALADAQNEAKSVFLHHMSHEMRTPLNGILATCSTLQTQYKTTEEKENLAVIRECADHLSSVIRDILDLALVESGNLVLDNKPMSIGKLLDSVIKMVTMTKLGATKVVYEISKDVPAFIVADTTRLKQVLLNLVSNGIKFSPDTSSVEVKVRLLKMENGCCTLEFAVKDYGIGIKPDQFSALFKPFSQVDKSFTRKFDGTGLGLSICKKIVEAMKGSIWLESSEGKGSIFFFSFTAPIDASPLAPFGSTQIASPDGNGRKLHILVVEDNMVNQKVICRMLSKLGHDVNAALNGLKAIELVTSNNFDVIFMDLNMPEMSGIDATIVINAMDWTRRTKPSVIALTACAFKEDQLKCLQVGMDNFISKPFTLNVIQDTLERFIQSHPKG